MARDYLPWSYACCIYLPLSYSHNFSDDNTLKQIWHLFCLFSQFSNFVTLLPNWQGTQWQHDQAQNSDQQRALWCVMSDSESIMRVQYLWVCTTVGLGGELVVMDNVDGDVEAERWGVANSMGNLWVILGLPDPVPEPYPLVIQSKFSINCFNLNILSVGNVTDSVESVYRSRMTI